MARTLYRDTLLLQGHPVENADVALKNKDTNAPLIDTWDSETGGIQISSVTTNSQGEIVFWKDVPETIKLSFTDDVDTRYGDDPGTGVSFSDFDEIVSVASTALLITKNTPATRTNRVELPIDDAPYGFSMLTTVSVFEPGVYEDYVGRIGINLGSYDQPADTTQPMVSLMMESQYRHNPTDDWGSEMHAIARAPASYGNPDRRVWSFFYNWDTDIADFGINGRLILAKTTDPDTPLIVFDSELDKAFRILNGTYIELTAISGAGADACFIFQRLPGDPTNPAHLQDAQIVRITANGNWGLGTWNQFGSGVGVEGIRDCGTPPLY